MYIAEAASLEVTTAEVTTAFATSRETEMTAVTGDEATGSGD